jgi:hypothetical protein
MAQGSGGRSVPGRVQSYPVAVGLAFLRRRQLDDTYDNLHCYEETRSRFPDVPVENAFMHNIHARVSGVKFLPLSIHHIPADFDNVILGTIVDFWIFFSKIVENVHRKSPIAGTNFIDDEIFVWKVFEEVLRHKALSNGLSIPWLKYCIAVLIRRAW